MVILNALESVLSIVIMVSTGYFLCYKKWLGQDSSKAFSKIGLQFGYSMPYDIPV